MWASFLKTFNLPLKVYVASKKNVEDRITEGKEELQKWPCSALIHQDRHYFRRTNQNGCGLMISLLSYNIWMVMPSLNSSAVRACVQHNTRGTRGANVPGFPSPPSICKSMQHATSTDDTSRLRNSCNLLSAGVAERQGLKNPNVFAICAPSTSTMYRHLSR